MRRSRCEICDKGSNADPWPWLCVASCSDWSALCVCDVSPAFAPFRDSRAPLAQVTWHGRNWDVLVGLTAPLMAWLVVTLRVPPRVAAAWNLAGLAILANTVVTVMTSVPGAVSGYNHWLRLSPSNTASFFTS